MPEKPSADFLYRLKAITSKRPRTVIEHILKHGHTTTEELKEKYGYSHAPRAARDVREQGIPLETFSMKGSDGRRMAAYRFGDPSAIRAGLIGGRSSFSKAFKAALVKLNGSRCQICSQDYEERYLQIDHRVPYQVAGNVAFGELDTASYMLLCGSCNRAKSWSCEHCSNWTDAREQKTCRSCYWASPEQYVHIALQDARRLDLVWVGNEAKVYDKLRGSANLANEPMPQYVKKILRKITLKEQR